MESMPDTVPKIVGLNIGGQVIQVKRDLLLQLEDNVLNAMMSRWSYGLDRDEAGNIFFDYSPAVMMPLIDWLRELRDTIPGQPIPPAHVQEPYRLAFVKMMLIFSFRGRHLTDAGISLDELQRAGGFDRSAWRIAGFDVAQLKEMGFDARQLKDAGFGAEQLLDGGFDARQLGTAGFRPLKLKVAGLSASQLRDSGMSVWELRDTGFDFGELQNAGFTTTDLRSAGFLC